MCLLAISNVLRTKKKERIKKQQNTAILVLYFDGKIIHKTGVNTLNMGAPRNSVM